MTRRAPCICDWPSGCGGLGVLYCDGCGGDLCVCTCGGEAECYGCAECNFGDYEGDDGYQGDDVDENGDLEDYFLATDELYWLENPR